MRLLRSQAPDDIQVFDLVEVLHPPSPPIPTRGRRGRRAEGALARAEAAARHVATERVPLVEVPARRRPHVRLGLAWAGVTTAAAWGGRPWLGLWFGVAAGITAGQVSRAWRRTGTPTRPAVAMLGAAAIPIAAIGGAHSMAPVLALVVAVVVIPPLAARGRDGLDGAGATLVAALAPGLAAAGPVLARGLGRNPALVLLALTFAYDIGSYVVGAGTGVTWEAAVAGAVSTAPVILVVASMHGLGPGFPAASPWVLGATAAVLAPLGPLAARAVMPQNANEPPGLGRLDVLLVLGPVWAYTAAALVR